MRVVLQVKIICGRQRESANSELSRGYLVAFPDRVVSSSGNTQPQSPQLAKPLCTDPGLKSGISVHQLISTFKKR